MTNKNILKDPILLLATGFGSGLAPKAPGTFGTLVAIPVYYLFIYLALPFWLAASLIVVLSTIGIWLCDKACDKLGGHDHGSVVWDEICGYLITVMFVPFSWHAVIAGFVLFRIFDIWKPWPIRSLDKKVPGGLGVMLDDIIAGFFAGIMLYFYIYFATLFLTF